MHRLIVVLIVTALLCSCVKAPVLDESTLTPSPSPTIGAEASLTQDADPAPVPSDASISVSLEERMASLSFMPVSGQYVRKSIDGDVEYTEMFALDRSSFVRAALDGTEEEIFAYNYQDDQFTYMYFFEEELLSKVVYDLGSETVLEDEDDLAELVISNAQDLKDYFCGLLDTAKIRVEELK